MANHGTLGALLGLLAQLEQAAYDFYRQLRDNHRADRELSDILADIMADEVHHARAVQEITDSLPAYRLESPVPGNIIRQLEETLAYVRSKGDKAFESGDDICTAIERMEALEFDVVLSFVSVSEIQFEFTRNYLRNQSVEHTNKIYRLQRCFD
jgi:rubrerythrin